MKFFFFWFVRCRCLVRIIVCKEVTNETQHWLFYFNCVFFKQMLWKRLNSICHNLFKIFDNHLREFHSKWWKVCAAIQFQLSFYSHLMHGKLFWCGNDKIRRTTFVFLLNSSHLKHSRSSSSSSHPLVAKHTILKRIHNCVVVVVVVESCRACNSGMNKFATNQQSHHTLILSHSGTQRRSKTRCAYNPCFEKLKS